MFTWQEIAQKNNLKNFQPFSLLTEENDEIFDRVFN